VPDDSHDADENQVDCDDKVEDWRKDQDQDSCDQGENGIDYRVDLNHNLSHFVLLFLHENCQALLGFSMNPFYKK
jgi:hypothetical protein